MHATLLGDRGQCRRIAHCLRGSTRVSVMLQGFEAALAELRADRYQRWAVPQGLPVHGVGHSNGALLHLLIGCQQATPNTSNVIISFNNKYVPCSHCRERSVINIPKQQAGSVTRLSSVNHHAHWYCILNKVHCNDEQRLA